MELDRFALTAEQLAGIPTNERTLLVLLGHGLNEINVLDKLMFFSTKNLRPDSPSVLVSAHECQAMVLARTLMGKLHAVHEVLKVCYFQTPLNKLYVNLLDEQTSAALARLNSYFGSANFITKLRNEIAFHYDPHNGSGEIPGVALVNEFAMYLHPTIGNCFYQFSEVMVSKALMNLTGKSELFEAMTTLLDEVRQVIDDVNAVSSGLMHLVLNVHIGDKALQASRQVVEVGEATHSDDVFIPYFFEVSPPSSLSQI